RVHATQVGSLDALGLDVRVAHVVGHSSPLVADFTLRCHFKSLRKAGTFSTGRWESQARVAPCLSCSASRSPLSPSAVTWVATDGTSLSRRTLARYRRLPVPVWRGRSSTDAR